MRRIHAGLFVIAVGSAAVAGAQAPHGPRAAAATAAEPDPLEARPIPDTVPEIVRKAFKIAESEKPGATHIELPEDVAEMRTEERPIPPIRSTARVAAP